MALFLLFIQSTQAKTKLTVNFLINNTISSIPLEREEGIIYKSEKEGDVTSISNNSKNTSKNSTFREVANDDFESIEEGNNTIQFYYILEKNFKNAISLENIVLANQPFLNPDTDGDGVTDDIDVDDDNDGILDATESPSCYYLAGEFESGDRTDLVEVSTTLSMDGNFNDPNKTVDGANGTGNADRAVKFSDNQEVENQTVYQFEFQQALELSTIYIGYRNSKSHFKGANIKLQASNNNATWSDLNDGATYNQTNSNSNVLGLGTIRNQAFEVTKNAGVYKYYRIQGVSGKTYKRGVSNEIYFETNNFDANLYPKDNCSVDTDGDGTYNHLDLDSDGDTCIDTTEAGTSNDGSTTDANNNGLLDQYEEGSTGTINYTSTYNPYAVSDFLAGCVDTDSDGVNDLLDIDDDNDGILDATESPSCYYLAGEFESGDRTDLVEVSTTLSMDGNFNDPNKTVDGANGTGNADYAVRFTNSQSATDQTVYQFEFQQAVELSAIYIGYPNGDSHFINGASIKLQASNNNATLEDDTSNCGILTTMPVSGNYTLNQDTILEDVNLVIAGDLNLNGYTLTVPCGSVTVSGYINGGGTLIHCGALVVTGAIQNNPTITQDCNNNSTWEDLNDGATYNQTNSNSNVPSVGTIRNQAFEVTKNAGVYKYYRIQGVSGTIWSGGESNEIYFQTNNFNASLYPKDNCSVDTDGDGIPNIQDLDSDNDGILDNIEAQNYSSYIAPSGIGSGITDSNGNGLDDAYESAPGVGLTPVNSDTDSLENFVDIDADNDGIPDNVELQRTNLYIAPSGIATSITDVNSNGVDDNYEIGGTVGITPVDTELDGIPDYVDTDTDNDGLQDIAENGNNNNVLAGTDADEDGLDNNFDNFDDTNISGYTVNNGINPPSASNLGDSDNDLATGGDVDFRDNVYTILITQVYQSDGKKMIEVTNIGALQIPEGTFTLNLFSNNSGDMTGLTPSASYTITSTLNTNQSIVIENNAGGSFSNVNANALTTVDDAITNFSDGNDIIILSTTSDNTAWTNRLDVIHSVNNITSMVLKDEESNPVAANDPDRWSVFIDDNLDPYRPDAVGGAERHPHDPLISDILNASENSNIQLGYHRSGETVRIAGAWNNGIPDRSRRVIINENYLHNDGSNLSARQLTIDNNSKLTIQDKLLIVTDLVTITGINDEIRLAGTRSQLITTHSRNSGISGNGKLYVDQNSDIPSTYRYNYFSSPVTTVGQNTFSVASVMKDGSTATSADSNAMDMNWTNGYDGSTTSPITIADYWIYSYGSSGNWSQLRKDGILNPADGFTLKGPGQEQNYTFEGTPNDGLIKTTVSPNASYLVGNPYPSAIDSKKFLEDNSESIYGTIYFWEHHPGLTEENDEGHYSSNYVGGYATRNLTMGIAAPNNGDGNIIFRVPGKYIPIAQGFFITGSNTGGEIVFKNSQREYRYEGDDSIFFRDGENNEVSETYQDPVLKIGLDYTNSDNHNLHRQIGVSFNENRSFSFDLGYDSPLYEPLENEIQYRNEETKMFWKFEEDDAKYVIAGIQEFSNDIEIPIGFSLEYDGEIIVKLDEQQNFEQDVYLKDKLTGATYKLSDNEQGVAITLSNGYHPDKYAIVFVESSLSTEDDMLLKNQLGVYVDNMANELVLKNYQNLDIKKVGLYNILGQTIKTWDNLGTDTEYRKGVQLPVAIYVVRITTENGGFVKKIRVN